MSPRGRRRRFARLRRHHVLALLFLLTASTRLAWTDPWYEHYEKAERALEAQNWEEAVVQINQAIERKGDSGARVRSYGMKVISYFPYLKLGIAYYQLGQFDAALQAFETEERLGAVTQSQGGLAELRDFRVRAEEGRDDRLAQEQQRVRQIVRTSLEEASRLEAGDRLDEAMTALSRGLSVAPEDADALAARERLLDKIGRQQAEQERQERAARLVDDGRALLDSGRYSEASSVLKQAAVLSSDPEVQSLLEDAQARILRDIEGRKDARRRSDLVADGLKEVGQLEARGDIEAALTRLQTVIALDPANEQAARLQDRLLEARARTEGEKSRRASLDRMLAEAESDIGASRFESALSAANRVLALDAGNASALEKVARAYREINRRLLGTGTGGNIPPAIRFADFRRELDDGSRVQQIVTSDFRLSGIIFDDSPVDVVFYDRENREIRGRSNSQPLGDYYITEFTLDEMLPPGLSTFRLVATDAESLSSSSEYIVVYEPPFYRTAWFYLTVGAILLGFGGLLYGRRAQKRERLIKRRFNPYVAGAPVLDESLFFGRARLIDRILQTIHNNSLLLYGERRIGKTSIQHQLKKRLERLDDPVYDFYPVYVDLQGTPENRFFRTLADDIFHDLAPMLDGLEPTTGEDGAGYTYRDFVRDIHRILKRLHEKSSKRVKLVLLIDEVDELNDYDPKINQKLRSLFMKSFAESLVSVVSGVEIKKQWEREGSPWYNFFEEIEVKPFRREDAEELIERPIRGIFKLEDGCVDRIISVTECKPYLIQKLCVALVNRAHEENRRTITLADVDAIGLSPEARIG
ncbi:MAG TPA: ATP-binding protein [Vicinamibacteria bacterium]|nr:ATP-binding protein [Vicinamibacteria bacterium]